MCLYSLHIQPYSNKHTYFRALYIDVCMYLKYQGYSSLYNFLDMNKRWQQLDSKISFKIFLFNQKVLGFNFSLFMSVGCWEVDIGEDYFFLQTEYFFRLVCICLCVFKAQSPSRSSIQCPLKSSKKITKHVTKH